MTTSPTIPTCDVSPAIGEPGPIRRPPTAGLPYHRLARLDPETARWWRPLAALAVMTGLAAGGLLLVALADLLATAAHWLPGASAELSDSRNPSDYLLMLGLLAVLTPATVLGVRWGWHRRGTLHSVAGRFRWRLLARAAVIVVPAFLIMNWGQAWWFSAGELSWPPVDRSLVTIVIIVIVLTPLQCAAEEYLFRALPQQILGTWLRSPLWGVLLPVPVFVLGHGYDWVGQIDIALFAVAMGFLVWKTGGVELSVLVHTSNNLSLFLLAPLSATSLTQGAVDPRVLLVSIPAILLSTAGLTWWVSRHHGLRWSEPLRHSGAPIAS